MQPNITVAIQNAAERRDVGVATGCMLLFRAIGGALGDIGGVMLLRTVWRGFGACAVVAALSAGIAAVMRHGVAEGVRKLRPFQGTLPSLLVEKRRYTLSGHVLKLHSELMSVTPAKSRIEK